MAEQLVFDLPPQVSLAPGDFFVSDANREAASMIAAPESWPMGKLVLVGSRASGKTHLTRIAASGREAATYEAAALDNGLLGHLPVAKMVIVENLDSLHPGGEEALFHLHNHVVAKGGYLLMTATSAPTQWRIALPDLTSRLQATAITRLAEPDDQLLFALLLKHFSDRQLRPAPAVLPYLVDRIERSYAAADAVVRQLDAAALAEGREITLPLARAVLDNSGA